MWEEYNSIPNISLDIYYCKSTEYDRNWKYLKATGVNEYFLKGISFKGKFHLNLGIIFLIKRYDLWIIGGYSIPSMQLAMFLCILFNIPYVLMFDGVNPQKLNNKEIFYKNIVKKYFLSHQFACLTNGNIGRLYVKNYGVPDSKIYNQYLTVDINLLSKEKINKEVYKKEIRNKYSIPEDAIVLIFVGRLVKLKGVQDLIKASIILRDKGYKIHTLIIGNGNYEKELKLLAEEKGYIHFVGYIESKIVYKYYYASDIFILPTYNDPWGLVVNEAMACGLPIITTTSCGVYMDLVKNNGFVYKAGDINELVISIKNITNKNIEKFGYRSYELIKNYTYKHAKNELENIIIKYKELRRK